MSESTTAESSAESTLKLALIGCGGIARAHWRGIKYHAPRIEVTAVVDTHRESADAMAERIGAPAYYSLESALADGDFDAVDIMLPHDLHEESTLACFEAGQHVCLEKPMAHTLESCERILQAAAGVDTVFFIAEQAQYWPDVIEAARLIKAGAVGEVLSARGVFYDQLAVGPDDPKPWRFYAERSGGGISIDGGAHWIRPLRMLLGEIDEVIAETRDHTPRREGESVALALFRFKSGVVASFEAVEYEGAIGPVQDLRVTGTLGELVSERGRDGGMTLYNSDHPDGLRVADGFPGRADAYGFELHDFSLAVLEGKAPEAEAAHSLGEFRTAQAMYRSAQSKRWEKVWD